MVETNHLAKVRTLAGNPSLATLGVQILAENPSLGALKLEVGCRPPGVLLRVHCQKLTSAAITMYKEALAHAYLRVEVNTASLILAQER